jgi:hypothetical protein
VHAARFPLAITGIRSIFFAGETGGATGHVGDPVLPGGCFSVETGSHDLVQDGARCQAVSEQLDGALEARSVPGGLRVHGAHSRNRAVDPVHVAAA